MVQMYEYDWNRLTCNISKRLVCGYILVSADILQILKILLESINSLGLGLF